MLYSDVRDLLYVFAMFCEYYPLFRGFTLRSTLFMMLLEFQSSEGDGGFHS